MAPTQDALYRELDLDLSWSERDLPERERTKHVHRLHPYLGKFVPQLVEALLERHLARSRHVLDPFAGSGTTLVQALESSRDATGVDVAAFNCLLMRVKTAEHNLFTLERELRDSLRRLERFDGARPPRPNDYLDAWYAPQAAAELVFYRSLVDDYEHADVLRVILARAARSARRTTHFDLDFPREPQVGEYWCYKHKKVCRPIDRAEHFLRRYALDTLRRIREFSRVRAREREAVVLHGDARELELPGPLRRRRHVAALPGADRLPRAAPLRVRAPRARRPARARARARRARSQREGDPRLRRRDRRGPRERARIAKATRAGRSSSSTTGASSTRRSSSGPGSGSRRATAGT